MPDSPSPLRTQLTSGAACRYDPELHDGPAHAESAQERDARVAVAIEVCAGCPVLAACEAYRVRVRPKSGVWAGQVTDSRDLVEVSR